ncbi:MAG: hypothetical protein HY860_05375 [Chlamydiales bacterium]|nr:hypothetical protein [Chlamydiales bacterium]
MTTSALSSTQIPYTSLEANVEYSRQVYIKLLNRFSVSPMITAEDTKKLVSFTTKTLDDIGELSTTLAKEPQDLERFRISIRYFKDQLSHIQRNFTPHHSNPFYVHALSKELIKILRNIMINGDETTDVKTLGKGSVGVVKACKRSGVDVVIKQIWSGNTSQDLKKMLDGNRKILELSHPAFASVPYIDKQAVYMERGKQDLFDATVADHDTIVTNFLEIAESLLQGLATLDAPTRYDIEHQIGETTIEYKSDIAPFANGDIKPENIMLFAKQDHRESSPPFCIKYIDHDSLHPVDMDKSSFTVALTQDYTSPQNASAYLLGEKYIPGTADDCWSLGITLFNVLTGMFFTHLYRAICKSAACYSYLAGTYKGIRMVLEEIQRFKQDTIDECLDRYFSSPEYQTYFISLLARKKFNEQMVLLGKKEAQEFFIEIGRDIVNTQNKTATEAIPLPPTRELFETGWKDYCAKHNETEAQALYFLKGKMVFLSTHSEEELTALQHDIGVKECDKIKGLIKSLLQVDPAKRFSAIQALDTFFGPDLSRQDSVYTFDSMYEFDPTL